MAAEVSRTNVAYDSSGAAVSAESAALSSAASGAAALYVPLSSLGAVSGVAQLDTTGQVTVGQVPGVYMPPTRRLPQFVRPSIVITQMEAGHEFTQSGSAGTFVANDTADYVLPTQSCKITTDGASGSCKFRKLNMASMDTTGRMLRCRIKVDDITHLKAFEIFLGSSSLANYYQWIPQQGASGSNYIISGGAAGPGAGWLTLTLAFADTTTTGTPVRTAVTDLQFLVQDDGAGTVTLHVQDVELIPDGSALWPNGLISIGFDDTYLAQYTAALPKLQQYGYSATCYTIQNLVGTSGRMTQAQLYALQDMYGWETGSHANTDVDHSLTYTGMTEAQLDADLREMKANEILLGMRGSDGTAYPLGQYGVTTDGVPTSTAVRRYNGYARTTSRKTYETFPPGDPLRLRAQSAIGSYSGNYPAATVISTDLPKIKAGALWGIYVFHNLVTTTPAASTECLVSDFNSIIDAIAAAGIPVLPVGDALRYYG